MKVSQYGTFQSLKVSSSVVAKIFKQCDETGSHDDRHRKGKCRVTSAGEDSLELPASNAAQINA
jgi:hypothetical protein